MEIGGVQEAAPRIDEHFDRIRANLIRCEECSENFFFDFLRHPRYFVTHFKTCHLKNVLYRFNGCSEEENQRVRFGPRRRKDAIAWFGQLKSTEKRMISMQDNKWGEIAERECWSCRLCKGVRKASDLPHAFEPNEPGRRQALLHLRQYHEAAYNAFLRMLPAVDSSLSRHRALGNAAAQGQRLQADSAGAAGSLSLQASGDVVGATMSPTVVNGGGGSGQPSVPSHEAERSRIRRMKATPEAKKAEAERSKRRRAQLTPAQRQVDADRRARKRQRIEERARSRTRRAEASPETKAREVQRSRERRQNATEQQRRREAQRSRLRRQNASEEQRLRERERCRRRYEIKKQQKLQAQQNGEAFGAAMPPFTPAVSLSGTTPPPSSGASDLVYAMPPPSPPPSSHLLPSGLEQRSQQLQQQQAGVRLQLQSLYDSLVSNPHVEL
ncbi:Reticulocyte-binding protein 2 a [Phytophthora cinnamomi]|uniref:Reticulocyte-binding protein 2 a n=1 Tax=Phytophthora cinnamomi TaxID=4785 RepID=UPI00355A3F46|nr:Reticulocyte-binding protein 2 a [Phytophthora cinnamomi]